MTEDEARGTTGGRRWPLGPIRILIIATAVLSVVFLIIPQLDIWFSRQFYDADIGFPASRIPALQWLRDVSGILLWVIGGIVVLSLLAKIVLFPRRPPVVPGRAMLFLSATLALSAGLLVNGILKSLWGRPRPIDALEFGGDAPFVTAWHISDYCARNCSFVSGEASASIWFVAVALVVPTRFRRMALAAALALAFVFSLNRIAFGGHFLSDVLLAWTLTLLIVAVAYHLLYVRPPRYLEETAIDGALTRAGLWLRGLAARRTKEDPPLHPEAVAVLTGAAIPSHTHGPSHAHENEFASPTGYRAAGVGFAETAAPNDSTEPPSAEHEPPHAWPDDSHGAGEAPEDDILPAPAAPAHVAVFPEKTAVSPARPEADVTMDDLEVAAADVMAAAREAGAVDIEGTDGEREEVPPPVHPAAIVAARPVATPPASPPTIGAERTFGSAPADAADSDTEAPTTIPDTPEVEHGPPLAAIDPSGDVESSAGPSSADASNVVGDATPVDPDAPVAEDETLPADPEAGDGDAPSPESPAEDAGNVDSDAAAAAPDAPPAKAEERPADADASGDEAKPARPLEASPPDRS